ncbi:MAG: DNA-primase RepB domain-containing protein [Zoogloea sp.]|uniref:TraI/MobA(P) family conjugative relaxase n=1 Tax=Zoogloea sp. TaxID=49181 RepID=UPI00260252CE|nr:TraI/MobA(P) family conjugative relaxase [Zoogloea sp.]MDD3326577.1 DNA-primase RepB domain-containing protein [Zoogloea sp.]
MIIKKIPVDQDKAGRKSKATNISDLTDYIAAPDDAARLTRLGYHIDDDGVIHGGDGERPEKVLYLTTRGFNTSTFKGQQAEMIALSMECKKSKYPIQHWVASWHEDEQPTPEQVEELLDVFLEQLGLEKHQIIAALHGDTDDIHLHIAVNKVSPETYQVVKPAGNGKDIEAAHRTVAIIEHRQGWRRERRGRYTVLEDGTVAFVGILDSTPSVPTRAADMEARTGQKSAARIAIEEASELIRVASSWAELHQGLAERGMRYVKAGGGAQIYVGEQPVKASTAGHWCSLRKLTKRLGAFEPTASSAVVTVERKPEPLRPDLPGWDDYIAASADHRAHLARKQREEQERYEQEMASFKAQKAERSAAIAAQNWKGKGELLNAMRSVAAAEAKKVELEIRERHRREAKALRDARAAWPDYHDWLAKWFSAEDAGDYRYHRHEPLRLEGDGYHDALPRDLRAFTGEIVGGAVEYRRQGAAGGVSEEVSFTDHGRHIDVQEAHDEAATLAALQLGAAKWGKVSVYGSDAYKAACVRLAAEHGIRIANPELQAQVEAAKEARRVAREEAMRAPQMRLFAQYHDAIGAERYTLTAIKMSADHRKAFVLGGKDGVEAAVVERRMRELLRLHARGENLYYTPRSEQMHHVLVDDLSDASLRKMLADGYKPAVVMESSPGKLQALLNVPKLGRPDDQDVGNRLIVALNKQYGDPKLQACIHPHRAPGFENRKWEPGAPAPKYQRPDGTFPVVELRHAVACTCDMAYALSCVVARQLDEEVRVAQERRPAPPVAARTALPSSAYEAHYRDIAARHKGDGIDLSRVDSMIAVRLRATGHGQDEIAAVLEACAPSIRNTDEGRNWHDYAHRTARYAFGPDGSRMLAKIERYRDQFLHLEGRDPSHEGPKMEA